MSNVIRVEDEDVLLHKLAMLADPEAYAAAGRAGGLHLKAVLAKYPPSTDANAPGPYPKHWYERGKGPRWALAGGGINGRDSSETLGRKWNVRQENQGTRTIVGNNANYGPFVQSKEKQTGFHAERGWLTVEEVSQKEGPAVLKFFIEQVKKILHLGR
jgi:hypothetical protein